MLWQVIDQGIPKAPDNPQPELHSSTDDKLSDEGKKNCNRNFQPSWKQTYPWLRFIEGKRYCGTCFNSNNIAKWLANPNSAFEIRTQPLSQEQKFFFPGKKIQSVAQIKFIKFHDGWRVLQWSDTFLCLLKVRVSFTDKQAQNKLKHQESAIYL